MANEITVRTLTECVKGGMTARQDVTITKSQTGNNFGTNIMTLTGSAVVVPVGGATTGGGPMQITNLGILSTGTYIDAGVANIYNDGATATSLIGTLAFGESMSWNPPTLANVSAKYVTGTLDLAVTCIEP